MGLIKKLFTNCACPQGRMGRAMLKFMNLCHAPLTNWGLKQVDIQDGWTIARTCWSRQSTDSVVQASPT